MNIIGLPVRTRVQLSVIVINDVAHLKRGLELLNIFDLII